MRAITLASMMAVVAGVVCILAGLLRQDFITELLSKPIRYDHMNGRAGARTWQAFHCRSAQPPTPQKRSSTILKG